MHKTPTRLKARNKTRRSNGHAALNVKTLKMNAPLWKALKKNAHNVVSKSVERARLKSAAYFGARQIRKTGLTFLVGICSGAVIGYLVDRYR